MSSKTLFLVVVLALVAVALPSSARALTNSECTTRRCIAHFQQCGIEATFDFTTCLNEGGGVARCSEELAQDSLDNRENLTYCLNEGYGCYEDCFSVCAGVNDCSP